MAGGINTEAIGAALVAPRNWPTVLARDARITAATEMTTALTSKVAPSTCPNRMAWYMTRPPQLVACRSRAVVSRPDGPPTSSAVRANAAAAWLISGAGS
jgi:hypothetical protein